MPSIADVKKQYPELDGLDDNQVVDALHETFYTDLSREEVANSLNVKPVAAPKPVAKPRNAFAVANDTVISVANAAAGGLGSAINFVSPGNKASKWIDENIVKPGEAAQSDIVKQDKASYEAEMDASEGMADEIVASLKYVKNNPLQVGAMAAGSFALPFGAMKGAEKVAKTAKFLGVSGKTASAAAGIGAGAAMSGGDAAGTAYELVQKTPDDVFARHPEVKARLEAGESLMQIKDDIGTKVARKASVVPAIIGGVSGAFGAEKILSHGLQKGAKGILATGAVEAGGEMADEASATYMPRLGASEYSPTIDPLKGVAGAATIGGVTGFGMGAGIRAVAPSVGDEIRSTKVTETGVLSKAANAGIEAQAQEADITQGKAAQYAQSVAENPPEWVASIPVEKQAEALKAFVITQRDDIPPGIKTHNIGRLQSILTASGVDLSVLSGETSSIEATTTPPQAAQIAPIQPKITPEKQSNLIAEQATDTPARAEIVPENAPIYGSAYAQRQATAPKIEPNDILDAGGQPFVTVVSAKRAAKAAGEGFRPFKIAEKQFVVRNFATENIANQARDTLDATKSEAKNAVPYENRTPTATPAINSPDAGSNSVLPAGSVLPGRSKASVQAEPTAVQNAPEKTDLAPDSLRWQQHKKDHIEGEVISSLDDLNVQFRPANISRNPYDMPTFTAIKKNGDLVGLLKVDVTGDVGKGVIEVAEDMRRRGVASTLYKLAEKQLGITMKPEASNTSDAKAFWNQPNRDFGDKPVPPGLARMREGKAKKEAKQPAKRTLKKAQEEFAAKNAAQPVEAPATQVAGQKRGDFYQVTGELTERVAKTLGLVVTKRNGEPMVGWSQTDHDRMVKQLADAGIAFKDESIALANEAAAPIPKTSPEIRAEQMRQQKIKAERANRLRTITYNKSPFLAFLGKHGVALSEKSEFSPDKNPMLSGYGSMFRRNGEPIDTLVAKAVEEGFLPEGTQEDGKLRDLISRAIGGERITALYTEEGATEAMQAEIERRAGFEEEQLERDAEAQLQQQFDEEALELIANSAFIDENYPDPVDALLELGFTYKDIEDTYNDYNAQNSGQSEDTQASGSVGSIAASETQSPSAEAPSRTQEEGLTAPIREGILTQQARAAQVEKDQAAADKAAEKAAKEAADKKEIDARQAASADNFQLGQSAEDSLSGQASIFDDKPASEMSLQDLLRAAAQKMDDAVKPAIQGVESIQETSAKVFAGMTTTQHISEAARIRKAAEKMSDLPEVAEKYNLLAEDHEIAAKKKEQKPPVASESVAEAATKTAAKIEDSGAVLEGARKLYAKAYAAKLDEGMKMDLAAVPLSKSWPEPDYQRMIDDGADPWAVAFIHAARDAVPAKPSASWKLKGWVEKVEFLRTFVPKVLDGTHSKAVLQEKGNAFHLMDWFNKIELYEAVGHGISLKDMTFSSGQYGLYAGVKYTPSKTFWTVNQKSAKSSWGKDLVVDETKAGAIEKFKAWAELQSGKEPEVTKGTNFDIYSYRSKPNLFIIGKRISSTNSIDLKEFSSAKEAREYKANNQAELEKLLSEAKFVPNERRDTNAPRVGEDHRNGADVTTEQFRDTFGFRGEQFGASMPQAERQSNMNQAYDALMDLSGVVGVPPKALSLNGELGLAFGARGIGGKNPAAAHYEQDATGEVTPNRVVINLTRKNGAGSLAHEWFHAVDNYFARMQGQKAGFMTERIIQDDRVRMEMKDAFREIMKAINLTGIKARSQQLDNKRTKAYWTTGLEMAARSFESYVIAKQQDQNVSNDYLANIVDETLYALQGAYPYPSAGEMPAIRAAFDNFFQVVQTKETDKGVAMFSRSSKVGEKLLNLAAKAKATGNDNQTVVLFPVGDAAQAEAKVKAGLDVSGYQHTVDMFAVRHALNRHSDAKIENSRGQIALTADDVAGLADVIANPDARVYGAKTPRGQDVIASMKRLTDGSILAIEEVRTGKKTLALVSMRKSPAAKDFDSIAQTLLSNAQSDSGEGLIVVKNPALDNPDANFSIGVTTTGLPVTQVKSITDSIKSKWTNAPEIVIAANMDDKAIPQAVRDHNDGQMSQGAQGSPEGFLYAGKVYLVADQLATPTDVMRVLFHETLGHVGLRGTFGKELTPILQQIAMFRKAEVQAKAREYGLDTAVESERLQAAEEVLAVMAQTKPEMGFVKRAIAAIRTWLRKHGVNLRLSDNDIIANYILPARAWVQSGKESKFDGDNLRNSLKAGDWYSELGRQVLANKSNAMPAGMWAGWIESLKTKGVKPDEIEWSGVQDWLKLQTGKVTKADVSNYLSQNGVQVQETVLGGDAPKFESARDRIMAAGFEIEADDYFGVTLTRNGEEVNQDDLTEQQQNDLETLEEGNEADAPLATGSAKYSQYQLPGGENYREVLLTLPEKGKKPYSEWLRDEFGKGDNDTPTAREMYAEVTGEVTQSYKSSHWEQPNVLAHIRLNDRTDADGNRVLFVEEVQSDWGQQGKKEGFKSEIEKKFSELLDKRATARGAEREAIQAQINVMGRGGVGVPNAPFVTATDKWLSLALKRVVKMAVDGGYDKVAFVNGEQSANRYDLSKQVKEIVATKYGMPSTGVVADVTVYGNDGRVIYDDTAVSPEKTAETIGKDLADKIFSQQDDVTKKYSGLDLKVGGEGMKAFYDKIVPNTAKEVIRKLGGEKVEVVDVAIEGRYARPKSRPISTEVTPYYTHRIRFEDGSLSAVFDTKAIATTEMKRLQSLFDSPPKTLQQPGFTITEAMKEKASGGMPLFSRQSQTDTPAFKAWFGDSKVVDAQGKPLVMYHGTNSDFSIFDYSPSQKTRGSKTHWMGFFFANNPEFASRFTQGDGLGANIMPVFLSIKNPYYATSNDIDRYNNNTEQQNDIEAVGIEKNGFDGIFIKVDGKYDEFVAFNPTQIKSATGNNGDFNPANPDIRFSRSTDKIGETLTISNLKKTASDKLGEVFNAPGKLSWWHKSFGTMYNLAERSPAFKPVFEAAQNFINDVSYYATDAADMAPKLLPKLESWRDLGKSPISAADNKTVSAPVFEGTLSWARDESGVPVKLEDLEEQYSTLTTEQKGKMLLKKRIVTEDQLKRWLASPLDIYEGAVNNRFQSNFLKAGVLWTDAELKSIFNLSTEQIGLYKEFRAATDKSLDNMAKAEMLRFGGKDVSALKDVVMEAKDADEAGIVLRDYLFSLAESDLSRSDTLLETADGMVDRADRVNKLKAEGYAPLSRFGKYSVDVVVDGVRQYFGLHETMREANQMAAKMKMAYGANNVAQGTMSESQFKLFAGITPESLELFGNMLGLDSTGNDAQDKAFQNYLKLTKTNRSAMRRMIHRKGISGYSEDMGRVLASFVYSNARQTSAALNMGNLGEAIQDIPKEQGELKDAAVALAEYIKNPQEEAQAIRGLLFAQYLGGSIASAFINLTQPFAVSFPWLSQYGGAKQSGAQLAQAMKDMANKDTVYEEGLVRALQHAEEMGIVSPQEIHQLMAQARGAGTLKSGDGTTAGDAAAKASNALSKVLLGWGKVFGLAEQLNRRSTFIAAYRIAEQQGIANPANFAEKAVNETQFVYSKASKMRFGRGAVGGTLMTFKTYSIAYMELLHRMYTQGGPEGKKAVLLALAVMMLMSGSGGLPFEDDLLDAVDGLLQKLGYNVSAKKEKQQFLEDMFGKAGADFVERGISGLPGMPLDVSGRLGMGNLIPGTGLLKQKTDHTRDVAELAGPMGDLVKRGFEGAGKLLTGDAAGAALVVSPVAIRNAQKGAEMYETDQYNDAKGYKVIETTPLEAALKAIGFQPATVAKVQESTFLTQNAKNFYSQSTAAIRAKWAKGLVEKDPEIVKSAKDDMADWNEKNPDQKMVANMPAILKKAREMQKTKEQRIIDTAPKSMRAMLRRDLAEALQE